MLLPIAAIAEERHSLGRKRVAHMLLDPDELSFSLAGDPAELAPSRVVHDPEL